MRSYLLILFIIFCLGANAQIKKGATLLGVNIGFFNQNERAINNQNLRNSNTNFIITPSYGKAIKENLILGVEALYQRTTYSSDSIKYKINSYGAKLLIRKYKYLGAKFYLFGESTFGGSINSTRANYINPASIDGNGFGVQLSFTPGISYALTKRLHLDAKFYNFISAAYTHTKYVDLPGYTAFNLNTFSFNTNLSSLSNVLIGLRVLINH